MQKLPYLTRKKLNERHGLSHQQIDRLLEEKNSKEHLAEKLELMLQVKEFIQLTDLFCDNKVVFTPLKGPVLSYRLYKDASFRYSGDLDFLLYPKHIKKAITILEKKGYKPYLFDWPENSKEQRALMEVNNQLLFINPIKNLHVELHWRLFKTKIINTTIVTKVLKSNRTQINFNGRDFQGFSNELELLYLIIHGGLHAWKRLKWLIDIKDYMENIPFDTNKFFQLATQLNAFRMVVLCNAMLLEYFPKSTLLPSKPIGHTKSLIKYCIAQIESEHYFSTSKFETFKLIWFRLNCFSGFSNKLSLVNATVVNLINKYFLTTK